MTADVLLLPAGGRASEAPTAGTVLVVHDPSLDVWRITLRGFTWGIRTTAPRYGIDLETGTPRWLQDGLAAAEGIAEAHGLGIHWHQLAPRTLIATGVFTLG